MDTRSLQTTKGMQAEAQDDHLRVTLQHYEGQSTFVSVDITVLENNRMPMSVIELRSGTTVVSIGNARLYFRDRADFYRFVDEVSAK